MTNALAKMILSDFTRKEFLAFVSRFYDDRPELSEEDVNREIRHFDLLVAPHPQRNGLIFWPEGGKDSAEAVVAEIERYCRENGLPCFSDSAF